MKCHGCWMQQLIALHSKFNRTSGVSIYLFIYLEHHGYLQKSIALTTQFSQHDEWSIYALPIWNFLVSCNKWLHWLHSEINMINGLYIYYKHYIYIYIYYVATNIYVCVCSFFFLYACHCMFFVVVQEKWTTHVIQTIAVLWGCSVLAVLWLERNTEGFSNIGIEEGLQDKVRF